MLKFSTMKKKTYIYTSKKQPFFAIIKGIFRIFLHKPKIINENDEFPTDGLIVAPHKGKWGPFYLSLHTPKKLAIIGAYPMLGNYKERFLYLRNVLYIQKCHKGKVFSTIKALFEAIFSRCIYKGMHIIPSYDDYRLLNTINFTQKTIENGLAVVIFPENSEEGYQDVIETLHEGFLIVARSLEKRRKVPTKIYPMYNDHIRKVIAIGKPFTLQDLAGKSNEEILSYTANRINKLNPFLEEDKKK